MKNKLLNLYYRYREIIDYIFFGGLTTLVNIVVFFIFDSLLSWPYLVANAIAIVLSILFAYVTNKLFVFKTSSNDLKENIYEFIKFIGFRLLSGLADMFSMWVLVDLIFVDTNLAKLLTQFIVVVLHYVFSKFFIFLWKRETMSIREHITPFRFETFFKYTVLFIGMSLAIFSVFCIQGKTFIWQRHGFHQHDHFFREYLNMLRNFFQTGHWHRG